MSEFPLSIAAKTHPQSVIALDDMSSGISAYDITVTPITEGEVSTGVWERPKTNFGISVEKRGVLDVM
jgi:hypothetical protein